MAIFLAAASKAIKSIDEITVGMELWEGSWQFRPGFVSDAPMIVTDLPIKFGKSRFNVDGLTEDNSSVFNAHAVGYTRDDGMMRPFFCSDNNIPADDDFLSYNDHFLFRSKEDAEEFVKAGAALLETDPNVITAFAFKEIEDQKFDAYDDFFDPDDSDFDFNFDDDERF